MKKIVSLLVFVTMCSYVFAQGGKIQFEKTTYEFGELREEVGEATGKFIFTNVGNGDLQLTNVQPGCGCTAADYTRTPIKPGEKGYVSATYHTTNRPGSFHKTITVTVNDIQTPTTVLYIKGNVLPKAKSKGDYYPTAMGNMKLMSNHIELKDVKINEIKVDSMKIYNQWDADMNIGFQNVPAHIQVKAIPEVLKKGEEGIILITYDASKKNDFGLVYDIVSIVTNDPAGPNKSINVSANISEDFSKLSPKQLEKAPKLKFEDVVYDFGKVKSGTVVKFSFDFTNEGKGKLIIRKVKPECGCTTVELEKKEYKKGQKGSINVVFDTNGRNGDEKKIIHIISNDPSQPNIQLIIQGEIYR